MCLQEQYQNAILAFQKAVELAPEDAEPYYHLGNAFYMLGLHADAIENYIISLNFDYSNGQVHFNLGSAFSA